MEMTLLMVILSQIPRLSLNANSLHIGCTSEILARSFFQEFIVDAWASTDQN